ncbi:hypothetical protein LFM09_40070 [Lentzea alba]|uniref:hypothetical protein n=1 Tax=Lentzea alba TaxID=2714351 RepID=UPI0039BFADC7
MDISLTVGSDARWKEDSDGCTIEILDENAVVSAGSGNKKVPTPGNNEQWRGPVREQAKQFLAAVQPKRPISTAVSYNKTCCAATRITDFTVSND